MSGTVEERIVSVTDFSDCARTIVSVNLNVVRKIDKWGQKIGQLTLFLTPWKLKEKIS